MTESTTRGMLVVAARLPSSGLGPEQGSDPVLPTLSAAVVTTSFEAVDARVVEGVPRDGAAAVAALQCLLRAAAGSIGIGCGPAIAATEPPARVPARAPRPPAHAAARSALAAAQRGHQGLFLRASGVRAWPARSQAPTSEDIQDAETCLWLLADLLRRRSVEGWAVADLMDQGLTGRECAARLDISASAVSQRAAAARYVEGRRAADLAARLLDRLCTPRQVLTPR